MDHDIPTTHTINAVSIRASAESCTIIAAHHCNQWLIISKNYPFLTHYELIIIDCYAPHATRNPPLNVAHVAVAVPLGMRDVVQS